MTRKESDLAALRERLLAHLQEVTRERDPEHASAGHAYVKAYLCEELSRYGTVTSHEFDYGGRQHQNLVLELSGARKDKLVLVGAHYDAVAGSPGADDNGTALAVLLELARALRQEPARSTIRLVAFDLEENDRAGSRAYAQDISQNKDPIELMIALEMLGYRDPTPGSQRYPAGLGYFYPAQGDFIGLIGNLRTARTMRRLATTMREFVPCEYLAVPFKGRMLPDVRRSDHSSFWDLGYPAIMVTDTANMRNPHYHRSSDVVETLDTVFLLGVCQGLNRAIRTL
jgi:Zn-dependent M28 family amino/carboxypeptidase